MRLSPLTFLFFLVACQPWTPREEDSGTSVTTCDMKTSNPIDMTLPPPCPAARGLSGDNLLCVDFADSQNTLASLTGKGWDFTTNCGGMNWQIANNLLQIKMFSMFSGSCALTLPQTTAIQITQHSRLTLSIQHRLDLNEPQQQARIFLNDDTDAQNVMWQDTAVRNVPRQRTVITVDSAELPVLLKTGFKWFLKASSTAPFSHNGWQIESVAVQGEP
jgi:hypothetical protein